MAMATGLPKAKSQASIRLNKIIDNQKAVV